MSAIQITTAAGICAMCDLLVAGKLPQKGFVKQEEAQSFRFPFQSIRALLRLSWGANSGEEYAGER